MEKIYIIIQNQGFISAGKCDTTYFVDKEAVVKQVEHLREKADRMTSVDYITFHSESAVGVLHAKIKKHGEAVELWGTERLESIEKHNAVLKDYNDNLQVVSELLTETIKLKRLLRVMEAEKVGLKNSGE